MIGVLETLTVISTNSFSQEGEKQQVSFSFNYLHIFILLIACTYTLVFN